MRKVVEKIKKNTLINTESIFCRMMTEEALKIADNFIDEESKLLDKLIKQEKMCDKTFIAIGAGPMLYFEVAFNNGMNYFGVEPHFPNWKSAQTPDLKIDLMCKFFEELNEDDLPKGRRFFVFIFNVASYIPTFALKLKHLLNKDDSVYISTWQRKNAHSKVVMKQYSQFVNKSFGNALMPSLNEDFKIFNRMGESGTVFKFDGKIVKSWFIKF